MGSCSTAWAWTGARTPTAIPMDCFKQTPFEQSEYMEDWMSGLNQQFTKLSARKKAREFESHILRRSKIARLLLGYFKFLKRIVRFEADPSAIGPSVGGRLWRKIILMLLRNQNDSGEKESHFLRESGFLITIWTFPAARTIIYKKVI